MKFLFIFLLLFFLNNCSFDNKTGIWDNEKLDQESQELFKNFEKVASTESYFNDKIPIKENFKFNLPSIKANYNWKDIFFNNNNRSINFSYNEKNNLLFKSKKITRGEINQYLLFEDNNLILNNEKGDILIYSLKEKKNISKFNFYKKKNKKIKKKLNLIVENNTIFVSDNLGYLYAYNYSFNKILWAKHHQIPFRSNLKLKENKLIAANQNNILYFFDKNDGSILNKIPTEDNLFSNEFVSNLSANSKYLFFLNTFGSIYSVDLDTMKLKWFKNLNQTLDINLGSFFKGNQIINNEKILVLSAEKFTYIIDINTGEIIYKINFSSNNRPLLFNHYLFLIDRNNLLIAFDIKKGEIIYSYDINESISNHLNIKKNKAQIKDMLLVNNKIFVFLQNSYLLKFNIRGQLKEILKFPAKINSLPIFIDNSFLYLGKKNKLHILD